MPVSAYPEPASPPPSPPFGRGRPVVELEHLSPHTTNAAETQGCWGAGGWAGGKSAGGGKISSKRIGGDPPEATDAAIVRASFRKLMLRRYHTFTAAWRAADKDMRGRLGYYELARVCHELGYNSSVRTLWDCLDDDRDGFVTFHEFNPDVANLLEGLAVCIWAACRTVETAWKRHFNKQGAIRCNKDMFVRGCQEIGFAGDLQAAYDELNSDMGTTGLCWKEFSFLDLWFAQEEPKPISVFHEKAEKAMSARRRVSLALTPKVVKDLDAPVREFKKLLLKSYGNYVRAWREGLDRDHNGVLDYEELKKACQDIGYPGIRIDLWNGLDADKSGGVSLAELDESTAKMLQTVLECVLKRYSSWEEAWTRIMDTRGDDRVDLYTFVKGCRAWGYGGNAERLFELLDTDRANYLSLDQTKWISGEDAIENKLWEDIGEIRISGKFKQQTASQARKQDFVERDRRLRMRQFAARDRGEMTGSLPSMKGATPEAMRRKLASSMSLTGNHGKQANAKHYNSSSMQRALTEKDKMSMSLSSFAAMAGGGSEAGSPSKFGTKSLSVGALSRTLSPSTPTSPGQGGWPSSKLGLARMANKEFREELRLVT